MPSGSCNSLGSYNWEIHLDRILYFVQRAAGMPWMDIILTDQDEQQDQCSTPHPTCYAGCKGHCQSTPKKQMVSTRPLDLNANSAFFPLSHRYPHRSLEALHHNSEESNSSRLTTRVSGLRVSMKAARTPGSAKTRSSSKSKPLYHCGNYVPPN